MRYFFIDYENVDVRGLNGVSKLTTRDIVIIYYSERHSRMTFGLHRRIEESPAEFRYRKIQDTTQKDKLDDELVAEVKKTVKNDSKADYYIISNDTGYNKKCIKELNYEGYNINLFPTISEGNIDKKMQLKRLIKKRLVDDTRGRYFDLSDDEIEKITNFIMQSEDKSELNRYLQSMFYNEDVKYIFTRIRDITYDM